MGSPKPNSAAIPTISNNVAVKANDATKDGQKERQKFPLSVGVCEDFATTGLRVPRLTEYSRNIPKLGNKVYNGQLALMGCL